MITQEELEEAPVGRILLNIDNHEKIIIFKATKNILVLDVHRGCEEIFKKEYVRFAWSLKPIEKPIEKPKKKITMYIDRSGELRFVNKKADLTPYYLQGLKEVKIDLETMEYEEVE